MLNQFTILKVRVDSKPTAVTTTGPALSPNLSRLNPITANVDAISTDINTTVRRGSLV